MRRTCSSMGCLIHDRNGEISRVINSETKVQVPDDLVRNSTGLAVRSLVTPR
ncbi:Uncharacterised protein [Mycobacteroides abscessus subsp. abscessus]|nr:Uncharacterised protein [Mycobacteroides abscessus subsp. abscessus]